MIPKKIKKIYLNNVDDMQKREYIDLSQVWHDASEVPQENEYVLIQYDENDYDVTLTQSTDEWDTWCGTCKIIRWAYLKDLLPKRSGNSEQLKGGEK